MCHINWCFRLVPYLSGSKCKNCQNTVFALLRAPFHMPVLLCSKINLVWHSDTNTVFFARLKVLLSCSLSFLFSFSERIHLIHFLSILIFGRTQPIASEAGRYMGFTENIIVQHFFKTLNYHSIAERAYVCLTSFS